MMHRKPTHCNPHMHRSEVFCSALARLRAGLRPLAIGAALAFGALPAGAQSNPGLSPSPSPLSGLPSFSLSGGDLSTSLPARGAGKKPRKRTTGSTTGNSGPSTGSGARKPTTSAEGTGTLAPRVLILTMFEPEAQPWLERMGPWSSTRIPGLSSDFPLLRCNRQQVCLATTGMGHSNAATSTMALALSNKLDLRYSYILIAGIAGINPEHGTLGTPAWARFLVDFGLQWELDAREAPPEWPSGYLGINTRSPSEKPPLDYNTEVFQLNGALLRKALHLSLGVQLVDGQQARQARARYPEAPANQPPRVTQCDSLSSDTWISGKHLSERATAWMAMLTSGRGSYCTNQQEDNATYEALMRGARMGRVDISRVMVLRAGADFDRPAPGDSAVRNLLDYTEQGGFDIAVENLYRAASPVVQAISGNWRDWKDGLPAH
jgi:purine nucleoside permease